MTLNDNKTIQTIVVKDDLSYNVDYAIVIVVNIDSIIIYINGTDMVITKTPASTLAYGWSTELRNALSNSATLNPSAYYLRTTVSTSDIYIKDFNITNSAMSIETITSVSTPPSSCPAITVTR
jgi:hypothetical protein